jgi:hypothetical protein
MSGAVFRLLLACVLAIAVPLQGMASVGMHLCSGHASVPSNGPAEHAHDHGDGAAHAPHDSGAAEAGETAGHQGTLTLSGCSACAPCCGVAAFAHVGLSVPEPAPSCTVTAPSDAADLGIDADVLQRPPRISLA